MILQREIAQFCRQRIPCNTMWHVGGVAHTQCSEHGPVGLLPFYEEVIENNSAKSHLAKFYVCPKCLEKEYGPIVDADEVKVCEVCNLAEAEVGGLNECQHCKAKACKGCMNGGTCTDCEDYGVFVC